MNSVRAHTVAELVEIRPRYFFSWSETAIRAAFADCVLNLKGGVKSISSIDTKRASAILKDATEAEMLSAMRRLTAAFSSINTPDDYGDKLTPTDYKVIMAPGDAQEQALFTSPYVHNLVLVYRDGRIVNEKV